MSLLRLLTAGRCWISAKPMGRYKFTDPQSMPKFGSGANPFKAKERKEERGETENNKQEGGGEKPVVRDQPVNATRAEEGIREKDEERSEKTAAEVGLEMVERGEQPETPDQSGVERKAEASEPRIEEEDDEEKKKDLKGMPSAARRPEKSPGWISKVGSLTSSLRMKLWKPRKSVPPLTPVQGELSLDNIKPVRNDLSETDLEVVPLRTSAIVKAKTKARQVAAATQAEQNSIEATQLQQPQSQEQDLIEAGRT